MRCDSIERFNPALSWTEGFFLKRKHYLFSTEGVAMSPKGRLWFLERILVETLPTADCLRWTDGVGEAILTKTDWGGRNNAQRHRWEEKIRGVYAFIARRLPFLFLFYTPDCRRFSMYHLKPDALELRRFRQFADCGELAKWLTKVTGRQVTKPFHHPAYLRCIDRCLRHRGAAHPGNLDALIFDVKGSLPRPRMLIEFSRVNYTSAARHRPERFLRQDRQRWQILWDVGRYFDVPVYAFFWGRFTLDAKIMEVKARSGSFAFTEVAKVDGSPWRHFLDALGT